MLDGLKRLFAGPVAGAAKDWDGVLPWSDAKSYTFREVGDAGFVIDGNTAGAAWRLEWGPSQRPYIKGHELRLRAELGLHAELQLVLLNRQLQEQMEKTVFDQYVEGVQTRIDNQTPPEMRWLVMFPKLGAPEMGALKDRYVALGSVKTWLAKWLEGPLAQSLLALRVADDTPVVLMIGRGRLMLRTAMPDPVVAQLQAWLRVFETAIREARRMANESTDTVSPSTHGSSLWSASALPGDERDGTK
ncbi:conserved hypothetical protein [Rubrivivax sp. A210]|uniref:hypothetical protein n=1 Tax=Rubrivivax sp. A210 TaxID=2772301 RepID=UPI001917C967|nr:hypothetical protein [Rubrivivax sp. A210]CAD5373738.1 conserved hypothetical protein [Rubrivivax sp. A210]